MTGVSPVSKLRIEGVTVRFKASKGRTVTALEDISLAIPDRELSCIVGPSGCGKSTLLRLVAGLAEATCGRITLDGRPIAGPSAERGMVFQSYTLFPWLTVRRNVEFGLELSARPRPSAARSPAPDPRGRPRGLRGRLPDQLSGGMRQRTALARALANDPEAPAHGRAVRGARQPDRALMQELLGDLERARKTMLFITHDIDEAPVPGRCGLRDDRAAGPDQEEITVDIPRPRGPEVLTAPRFVALKRQVLALIREEAMQALAEA